jgi:hypothetical protein
MWKPAFRSGLTYDAKQAESRLFTRVFRIHPQINEICFEVSTPSVGTITLRILDRELTRTSGHLNRFLIWQVLAINIHSLV